ncbi:MAG: hypothetical protein AAGJ46_16015 [Planctomycetota bacterium]
MTQPSATVVHGFAVVSVVFRPLLATLRRCSINATLCRFPSVGVPLQRMVDEVADDLSDRPPHGIVAHSLGCIATLLAVDRVGWAGPIVLLAPPAALLPSTKLIPSALRWPFGPLLDHRTLMASSGAPETPPGCRVLSVAGRYDCVVPASRTKSENFEEHVTVPCTHNGLLFSERVARLAADWLTTADVAAPPARMAA